MLMKKSVVDGWTLGICVLVFLGSAFLELSPVLYVLAAGLCGILICSRKERRKKP